MSTTNLRASSCCACSGMARRSARGWTAGRSSGSAPGRWPLPNRGGRIVTSGGWPVLTDPFLSFGVLGGFASSLESPSLEPFKPPVGDVAFFGGREDSVFPDESGAVAGVERAAPAAPPVPFGSFFATTFVPGFASGSAGFGDSDDGKKFLPTNMRMPAMMPVGSKTATKRPMAEGSLRRGRDFLTVTGRASAVEVVSSPDTNWDTSKPPESSAIGSRAVAAAFRLAAADPGVTASAIRKLLSYMAFCSGSRRQRSANCRARINCFARTPCSPAFCARKKLCCRSEA